MGVGKTERAGMNDSRFTKGRRIDATNDRVLRNLQVKGGRVHRSGDKWTIETSGDNDTIQPAFPGSAPGPRGESADLSGYEEVTLNFITESGIIALTVLAKVDSLTAIRAFTTDDSRMLIAIGTDGKAQVSKGYLKA